MLSKLSLRMDPEMKDFVVAVEADGDDVWSDLITPDDFESNRIKRQIYGRHQPGVPDCWSKRDECQVILDGELFICFCSNDKIKLTYLFLG